MFLTSIYHLIEYLYYYYNLYLIVFKIIRFLSVISGKLPDRMFSQAVNFYKKFKEIVIFDQFANSGDMACILDLLSAGKVTNDSILSVYYIKHFKVRLIILYIPVILTRLRYHLLIQMHLFLLRILCQVIVVGKLVSDTIINYI